MAVTQVHEALGSFEFELLGNVPRDVLDTIQHFSHIAIIPGRLDPRQYGDGCLAAARYVGVVRRIKNADDGRTNLIQDDIRISGVGTEFWLGDDDNKGYIIESLTDFTGANFTTVMDTLRPSSVNNGTIYPVSGAYSGRHQYETPRSAIQYVCDTMSTAAVPVGYKVSNDIKLFAGPESDLFVTNPVCIIMRKGSTQGEDMFMRALPSTLDMDEDMEDFATRVVMLAEADGDTFATGTADIATVAPGYNVFKDINGQPLKLTKLVSESDTLVENADTRAELALREVIEPHRTLTLAADDYDIHGTFEVGDYIWVYDPDAGLVDTANEVQIRGVRVNPVKLRVTESDWPVTEGYTVAHRDADGNWMDITDYVHFDEEQTSRVVVGDYNRELTGSKQSVDSRTGALIPVDSTVPGQVSWVVDSFQTTNYSDAAGQAKARQKLVWSTPVNVGGSAITDGSHYELQYKLDVGSQYSQTWAAASTLSWDEANVWNQPVEPDDVQWQTLIIPWGDTATVIHELPVGTGFDSRIRAVDKGGNQGAWSLQETWVTSEDNIPPSAPAAPVVAGSAIAIQVIHELGKASGGTFNLESDLAQLEVHYSQDEGFFPTDASLAGRLRADRGMMAAGTAAIGTFPIPETDAVYVKVVAVDLGGNRSSASAASQVSADLIDSQYISELTASKISAGTLGANILLAAAIKTAEDGQRVELNQQGLQAYDAEGDLTVNISSNPSGGDYISLQGSDGTTVASISDTGDATFANVYGNTEIYHKGNDLTSILDALPKGVIAWGPVNVGDRNTSSEIGLGEIAFEAVEGRMYKYTVYPFLVGANTDNMTVGLRMRHALNSTPDITSPLLGYFYNKHGGTTGFTTLEWSRMMRCGVGMELEPGTEHIFACLYASGGTATVYNSAPSNYVYMSVEDCGVVQIDTAYNNTGIVGSGGGEDPDTGPIQTYTKTYSSTWTRSYQGDNDLRISNGDMYQGYYSSTQGNQKSLIGFDWAAIQSDLNGATISKVEMTLKNSHFYNNSGGTLSIGSHNYSSAPSTWGGGTVNEQRLSFSSWAKGAKKTVSVGVTFGNELRDGVSKGIAIGPGPSTSLTYYSFWVGQNGGSDKPTIKITYTK